MLKNENLTFGDKIDDYGESSSNSGSSYTIKSATETIYLASNQSLHQ